MKAVVMASCDESAKVELLVETVATFKFRMGAAAAAAGTCVRETGVEIGTTSPVTMDDVVAVAKPDSSKLEVVGICGG